MVSPNFPVPERIPGQLISDHQHLFFLKQHLATLCGLRGAQKSAPFRSLWRSDP
jgi:hypothetical protein